MSRPAGVRNQDYEDKRTALLDKLMVSIERPDICFPSLRQLSIDADVSDVTLRHYFCDRRGVILALLERIKAETLPLRDAIRQPAGCVGDSLSSYMALVTGAVTDSTYMHWHIFALREGMVDPEIFKAYIDELYMPGIEALAERLTGSEGGPSSHSSARRAASLIVCSAMVIAVRHLLDDRLRETGITPAEELTHLQNWMLHGMLNDPDAKGL